MGMANRNTKQALLLKRIAVSAVVAALYTVPNIAFPALAFGPVQFRISEALCLLPFLFPEAVAGLFVGCVVSNILSPNIVIFDIILGSAATGIAAYLTYRAKNKYIALIPPILLNTLIIPLIFVFSSAGKGSAAAIYFSGALSILISEGATVTLLGLPLITAFQKITKRMNLSYKKDVQK